MFSKKTALLGVFIVAVIGLSAWALVIYKHRASVPTKPAEQNQTASQDSDASPSLSSTDDLKNDSDKDESANSNTTDNTTDNTADNSTDEQDVTNAETDTFLDVTTQDCDNNCKSFSDAEDLKYCQNVCGLSKPKKTVSKSSDCAAIEDSLEQDYCYKDLAISKKDMKICDNIGDTNIKKTCTNRITEDIIDAQMESPSH